MEKETISVEDEYGFHYDVTLEHHPQFGFTNAMYGDDIIDQCILNKIYFPIVDNDREHEAYEERFSEWKDAMKDNLLPRCKEYFDRKNSTT